MAFQSHDWPKLHERRTIVLCFDGTADEFDEDNSNVVKFFSLLKKDDEKQQICYYQSGIGTYFQPGVVSPILRWFAKTLDMAVAWYLDQHVMDGYRFLMSNYRKGDKICMFGFSRGAYVARALAGFLQKIGLLLKGNIEQVSFAYKLYERTDEAGVKLAAKFKQSFCRHVEVDFVGVWDTVCSVGILNNRTLPFVTNNKGIKTFRHALALDERRAKFRPNLWHQTPPPAAPPPTPERKPSRIMRTVRRLTATKAANPDGPPASAGMASPPLSDGAPSDFGTPPPSRNADGTFTNGVLFAEPPSIQDRSISQRAVEEIKEIKPSFDRARSNGTQLVRRFPELLRKHANSLRRSGGRSQSPHVRDDAATHSDSDLANRRPHERRGSHSDSDLPGISLALHHADETIVERLSSDFVRTTSAAGSERPGPDTDVLEVWFSGAHADVGGGAVKDDEPKILSQIPLRWMIREVTAAQCGIIFDQRALRRLDVQLSLLGSPRKAGRREKILDFKDAKADVNDMLTSGLGRAWWMLELTPTLDRWQNGEGVWRRKWRINRGHGRDIPSYATPLYFHFTVKQRMEDHKLNYFPRANWIRGTEEWIE